MRIHIKNMIICSSYAKEEKLIVCIIYSSYAQKNEIRCDWLKEAYDASERKNKILAPFERR